MRTKKIALISLIVATFVLIAAAIVGFLLLRDTQIHDHEWGEWKITLTPTCTEAGKQRRRCRCGASETDDLDALGHQYGDWTVLSAATCSETGVKEHFCTVCDHREEQAIEKTVHSYSTVREWIENDDNCVSITCDVCGISSDVAYDGIYLNETNELYLMQCPTDYAFNVVCADDEDYVRDNVIVVESFYERLSEEQCQTISEELKITSLGGNRYQISSATGYAPTQNYSVMLNGNLTFEDYPGKTLSFRTSGEGSELITYNEDILFLASLINAPYSLTFDESTSKYNLVIADETVFDSSYIGKLLLIGDCTSFNEIEQCQDTYGSIVIGQIETVTTNADQTMIALGQPALTDIYTELDISTSALSDITAMIETEDYQNTLLKEIVSQDGFAEALSAVSIAANSYASSNGMKAVESPLDLSNFDIQSAVTTSAQNTAEPWVNAKFTVTYTHPVDIIKEGKKYGEIKFTLVFDIDLTFTLKNATAKYEIKCKSLFDINTALNIQVDLSQRTEVDLQIKIELELHDTDPQAYYIVSKSGKIHYYSCSTCAELRKDHSNYCSLEEIKKIPNYTEYECQWCKPFTMDGSKFVLNTDTGILHCGNCVSAGQITAANIVVYEMYPFGGTHTDCERCKPSENQKNLDEYLKESLKDSAWDTVINKIKQNTSDLLKGDGASPIDTQQAPVATLRVAAVFEIPIYIQPKFDFDLEASLDFHYNAVSYDLYMIRSGLDNRGEFFIETEFDSTDTSQNTDEDTWKLDLQGKISAKIGVMTEIRFSFVGMSKFVYVGLFAEAGAYADLNGVLHLDSKDQNYYAAYLEAGIYFDVRMTYKLPPFIEEDSQRLFGDDIVKFPIFKGGDSKAYYAFAEHEASAILDQQSDYTLSDELLSTLYFDLTKMESCEGNLSWKGNEQYALSCRIVAENGNEVSYCKIENGKLVFTEEAPDEFSIILYVSVNDLIQPANFVSYIFTHNDDGAAFYMDELAISLYVSKAAHEHTPEIIPEIAPTCMQTGRTEGTYCSTCESILVYQEVVPQIDHRYHAGICEMCGINVDPVATTSWNGSIYMLYDAEMTWQEAKEFCENNGGHLVTITSLQEQLQIESLMSNGSRYQYWMGWCDSQWITGEAVTYANWDTNQPDATVRDDGEIERYGHILNSSNPAIWYSTRFAWNDMYYDNTYPGKEDYYSLCHVGFICEVSNSSDESGDTNEWLMADAYYDKINGYFVLTEDYSSQQTGSIWYNHPYENGFTLEMDYYTGSFNRPLDGADGIVVAFFANYSYTMSSGEEIGFTGCGGYGIELDTYQNETQGDPGSNHIALIKGNVGTHLITNDLPESEDEQWHHLKGAVDKPNHWTKNQIYGIMR